MTDKRKTPKYCIWDIPRRLIKENSSVLQLVRVFNRHPAREDGWAASSTGRGADAVSRRGSKLNGSEITRRTCRKARPGKDRPRHTPVGSCGHWTRGQSGWGDGMARVGPPFEARQVHGVRADGGVSTLTEPPGCPACLRSRVGESVCTSRVLAPAARRGPQRGPRPLVSVSPSPPPAGSPS